MANLEAANQSYEHSVALPISYINLDFYELIFQLSFASVDEDVIVKYNHW